MVGHPTILRGLALPDIDGDPAAPTALTITEQDFLPWFLTRLETPEGQQELGARDAFARLNEEGQARMFQPVHRSFNIVAVEVACEVEGLPRLDPRKIISAGVTLRRRVSDAEAQAVPATDVYKSYGGGLYGWMRQEGKVLGWRQIFAATDEPDAPDVSPEFRALSAQGKNARILKHAAPLQTEDATFSEAFSPLFPASDELCKKLGKTILFGYLPVTSDERSEADAPPAAPFTRTDVSERLPSIFWPASRKNAVPVSERPADPPRNTDVSTSSAANPSASLSTLITALNYLSQEAGLFLEGDNALRTILQGRTVTLHDEDDPVSFYSFLVQANAAFIERNPEITTQAMPETWPTFTEDQQDDIIDALLSAISARWADLSPGETRFQNMDARYEIQAFARIDRSDCGCPPETVWTRPSPTLEIVPWYEGGEAPPTIVELPNPSALKGKISPNVAFKVPEEIQKFMSGMKLDKLMDGEQPSEKLGWGMICGFSIPIITICAFIVLQIFLSLFHILFWWLPFIRICIPFPRKESS